MNQKRIGYTLLGIIGVAAIIAFGLTSPIRQNEDYHNFSDSNIFLSIPNFRNVISNTLFLIVGLFGVIKLKKMKRNNLQFLIFFIGIILVGIGSSYYHFNPNNNTLVWDRLPMTIAFTALTSIVVSEFIDYRKGKLLLFPFLILGIISILYWIKFDDLRLYVLVQFYPILAIPVILIFFKSNENKAKAFWFLLIAYVVAKFFEIYDYEIHDKLEVISGHSLKHIVASIGVLLLIKTYSGRNKSIEKQLYT